MTRRHAGFKAATALLMVLLLALGCAGKRTEAATDATATTTEDGAGGVTITTEDNPLDAPVVEAEDGAAKDEAKTKETAASSSSSGVASSEDRTTLPGERTQPTGEAQGRRELSGPPSYGLWARSLRHYEQAMGIEFYRNGKGRYEPFAAASWDSFSIADRSGDCLYDVDVVGTQNFRSLEGRQAILLEMDVRPGACGLTYPKADMAAMDRVSVMEGTVVSPELVDRLGSSGMCSDVKFLAKTLQLPYQIEVVGDDLEQSVAKASDRVANALDLALGDVVFFSDYPGEDVVGIYAGYGLIVYNTCFGANAHQMRTGGNYRIYRLLTGFDWTRYRMHHERFLRQFVGGPK
jgi:hypothetical protein